MLFCRRRSATPKSTSRDHQEQVVRLAQEERCRSASVAPSPLRPPQLLAATASPGGVASPSSSSPTLARRRSLSSSSFCQQGAIRVSTPHLKEMVMTDVAVSDDGDNGASPTFSNNASVTSPTSEPENSSGAGCWQTVGPLEFARLQIRARSVSPWALHVESELVDFTASESEKAHQRRVERQNWAEATQLAAEQRRLTRSVQLTRQREAELAMLKTAKAMEANRLEQQQKHKKQSQQARRREYEEHCQLLEAIRLAGSQSAGDDRHRASEETATAARQSLSACVARRNRALQCSIEALALAVQRKSNEEARQHHDDEAFLESRARRDEVLEHQRESFSKSLQHLRDARQDRADRIASSMPPSKKELDIRQRELACDRSDASLTSTTKAIEASIREDRRKSHLDLIEAQKTEIAKKRKDKEMQRESQLAEGRIRIQQDCIARDKYDTAQRQRKLKQQQEVRESLEHIQKMKLRQKLSEAGSQ